MARNIEQRKRAVSRSVDGISSMARPSLGLLWLEYNDAQDAQP